MKFPFMHFPEVPQNPHVKMVLPVQVSHVVNCSQFGGGGTGVGVGVGGALVTAPQFICTGILHSVSMKELADRMMVPRGANVPTVIDELQVTFNVAEV